MQSFKNFRLSHPVAGKLMVFCGFYLFWLIAYALAGGRVTLPFLRYHGLLLSLMAAMVWLFGKAECDTGDPSTLWGRFLHTLHRLIKGHPLLLSLSSLLFFQCFVRFLSGTLTKKHLFGYVCSAIGLCLGYWLKKCRDEED